MKLGTTKKIPQRQCVGCRMMKNKKELIRILKTDEGIIIDDTGKKNGRGAYICPNAQCLKKAIENKGLERSFKMPVDKEVYEYLRILKQDKTLLMLGLAQRAGKVASGEFSTEKAVKSKKAFLVVVASDASDNTKKMFSDMCTFYKVPIAFYSDKVSLGHAIGKEFRASLAVLDEGFGKQIQKHLEIGME